MDFTNESIIQLICTIASSLVVIGISVPISIKLSRWALSVESRDQLDYKITNKRTSVSIAISKVQFTNNMLELIRTFVTDMVQLSYQQFSSEHNLSKVNKGILVKFVGQVSQEAKDALSLQPDDYSMMFVTEDYIDRLIVDTVVYVSKQLFENEVADNINIEQ